MIIIIKLCSVLLLWKQRRVLFRFVAPISGSYKSIFCLSFIIIIIISHVEILGLLKVFTSFEGFGCGLSWFKLTNETG